MPIAVGVIENPETRKETKIKILFDQGSQRTYISEKIKNVLNLRSFDSEKMLISTFGAKDVKKQELEKVSFNLKCPKEVLKIEALVTEFICLPIKGQTKNCSNFEFLKNIELAETNSTENVDLLIGSDFYWHLVTGRVKFGKPNEPVALETKIGWILNGPVRDQKNNGSVNVTHSALTEHVLYLSSEKEKIDEDSDIERKLEKFWNLESIGILENEKHSQDHFIESIYLNEENRYETKLPFKEDHDLLHDHFELCQKRLEKLHEKLKSDPDLLQKYN